MSNEASVQSDNGTAEVGNGGAPTSHMDPGFKRNIRVIGLVVVIAVVAMGALILMMRGGAKAITENKSDISLQEGVPVKSNDGLTPAMRQKLMRAQTRESGEAGAHEQSYIPPDILPEKSDPHLAANSALQQPAYAQGPAAADPAQDRRNQERLRAAEQILTGMLQRPVAERVDIAKIDPPAAPAARAATPGGVTVDKDVLVDIMEIFGARLTSPVDTDMSTYASAEITTGKLAGALLIGSVKLVGEGLEFKFTGMRFNSMTYPINAIALDAATSTSAVEGDIDRKILSRYVFPILMAYTGAYATAKAQVATTTAAIMGVGADYGIARAAPTSQQATAAGVAAAVQIGNQAVGQSARTPVRVSMPAGVSIGVMFRDVVTTPPVQTKK